VPSNTRTLEEILDTLRTHMPQLRERHAVRSIGVFGSYARGQQTNRSDLDLLVEFDDPPGLLEFIALENELSDLLGVKVDLVTRNALRPRIGKRILEEVVML